MKFSRPKNLTFSWKLTFVNATKSNILRLQNFIFREFAKKLRNRETFFQERFLL